MSAFDELEASLLEDEVRKSVRPEDHYAPVREDRTYPYEGSTFRHAHVWFCGVDGACLHSTEAYAVEHKADVDRRRALPEQVRVTVTYTYTPKLSNYPAGTVSAYKAKQVDEAQCPEIYDVLSLMEGAVGTGDPGLTVAWSTVSRWDKDR